MSHTVDAIIEQDDKDVIRHRPTLCVGIRGRQPGEKDDTREPEEELENDVIEESLIGYKDDEDKDGEPA